MKDKVKFYFKNLSTQPMKRFTLDLFHLRVVLNELHTKNAFYKTISSMVSQVRYYKFMSKDFCWGVFWSVTRTPKEDLQKWFMLEVSSFGI